MTEPTTHPTPSTQALQNAVLAMPMARTLGLRFVRAEPGATELEMPIADALCFQPGQLQATAIFALGDFAAVSAAGSLLPAAQPTCMRWPRMVMKRIARPGWARRAIWSPGPCGPENVPLPPHPVCQRLHRGGCGVAEGQITSPRATTATGSASNQSSLRIGNLACCG